MKSPGLLTAPYSASILIPVERGLMKILFRVIFMGFLFIIICSAEEIFSDKSSLFCEKHVLNPQSILVHSPFSELVKKPLFSMIENKGMDITRNQEFIKRWKNLQADLEGLFRNNPAPRILIGYHDDADGVMSAKITQIALMKFGSIKNCKFRPFPIVKKTEKEFKSLPLETFDRIIMLDSFWTQKLYFQDDVGQEIKRNLIVIDHHVGVVKKEQLSEADRKHFHLINLNNIGYDGESKHMPASALTALIFNEMKDRRKRPLLDNTADLNLPLPVLLAAGIIGDRGYAEIKWKDGKEHYQGGFLLNQKEIFLSFGRRDHKRHRIETVNIKTNLMEIAQTVNWYLSSLGKLAFESILENNGDITLRNIAEWIHEKRTMDKKVKVFASMILYNPLFENEKVICIDLQKQIVNKIHRFFIGNEKYEIDITKSVDAEIIRMESKTQNPRIVACLQDVQKDNLYKFSLRYDGDKEKADLFSVVQFLKGKKLFITSQFNEQKNEDPNRYILAEFFTAFIHLMENLVKAEKLAEWIKSMKSEKFEELLELEEWIGWVKMEDLIKESEILEQNIRETLDFIASENLNVSIKNSKLFRVVTDLKACLEAMRTLQQDPLKADELAAERWRFEMIKDSLRSFRGIPESDPEFWKTKGDWVEGKRILKLNVNYSDGGGHPGAVAFRFNKKQIDDQYGLFKLIEAVATDVQNAFKKAEELRELLDGGILEKAGIPRFNETRKCA